MIYLGYKVIKNKHRGIKDMKKQFKGFVIGVLVTLILTSTIAFAGGVKQKIDVVLNSINLTVNGKAVKADNILYKGTTYVPIRQLVKC